MKKKMNLPKLGKPKKDKIYETHPFGPFGKPMVPKKARQHRRF